MRLLAKKSVGALGTATVLALVLADISHGTSIVVATTSESIVLAADSMVTWNNAPPSSACKIHRSGRVFFAVSGLAMVPETRWNAVNAAMASSGRGSLREIANSFERLAQPALLQAVEYARVHAPTAIEKILKREVDTFKIIFAAIERRVPTTVSMAFQFVADHQPIHVIHASCPGDCGPGPIEVEFLGYDGAIRRHLATRPPLIGGSAQGLADFVISLVRIQIAARQDVVGGPIDAVRLHRDGSTHVLSAGVCPKP